MNTPHLSLDRLTGYLYQTLDDATRESMDAHLATCPICRAQLDEQKRLQRVIANELYGTLNQTRPSNQMMFSSIAAKIKPRSSISLYWERFASTTPIAFAVAGLVLALVGVIQQISVRGTVPVQEMGSYPTLACFFLMLVSVEQFDKALSIRPRFILMAGLAFILWLGSALIGVLNITVIQDLAIYATLQMGGRKTQVMPIAMFSILLAAILYIIVVVGGGEYHYRHIGQPNSWKVFSITLLAQLFILILPYLIF
ncbi:MAG: zf-HC2 domain-containing protein [Anaerolineales bacterium]|nr:zf-HC2 domain-containing protein [Anaerolineales bacterium]